MARGSSWANNDGLTVEFGTRTADNASPGVTSGGGAVKTMVMEVVGVDLVDTISATNIPVQSGIIKRGSAILSATFVVSEAFTSGGVATLDLGTWGIGASTQVVDDADGIDVDIALTAIDAIGDVVNCDGALVGGLITAGGTSNSDVCLTASYETAVFTAGRGVLTVRYIEPQFNAVAN